MHTHYCTFQHIVPFLLLNAQMSIYFRGLYLASIRGWHLLEVWHLITIQLLLLTLALFLFDVYSYRWHTGTRSKVFVKGHHIYKSVWMPVIGEELHTKLKKDNKYDEHAVAVTFDGRTVGHYLATAAFKIFPLPPWPEALFRQWSKTSAYETPSYPCGHVEHLNHAPHGYMVTQHVLEAWRVLEAGV